jgi:hypothetical protein
MSIGRKSSCLIFIPRCVPHHTEVVEVDKSQVNKKILIDMRDPCHEEFEQAEEFSSGSSYRSFALATIEEEWSLYSDSSFSSFGSVSSFDSAIISAESLCSLCSGGRFEILALSKSESTLTIPPIPKRVRRPTEIFCDMQANDLDDQDVAYRIHLHEDVDEYNSIDSDAHLPRSPIAYGGAECTQPLNHCEGLNDDLKCSNNTTAAEQCYSVLESKHEEYPVERIRARAKNGAEYAQSRNNKTCHMSSANAITA